MIIYDTETTGLLGPDALPLEKQPSVIEFGAIKYDPIKQKIIKQINFLIDPGKPIPASITKITGITDEMVKGQPSFGARFEEIAEFFFGSRFDVAHNNAFDNGILRIELERIGKLTTFPWALEHICTVERTVHLRGYRLKLADLFEELTGKKMKEAHRTSNDIRALATCTGELIKRKIIITGT